MSDATEPTPAALEAINLTKSYGERVALDDTSLRIERGELVALVGSNGAGKSTLLQLASGLLDATSGTVSIEGERAGSLEARGYLSLIPDEPSLYDDLSVNEHVEYIARLHGLDGRPESADELLDLLELSHRADDLPARFSRGLRQKTSILLGVIRPFSVLLVDEPFVGLDPSGQRAFVELVEGAAEAGAAILLATHQLAFLDSATRCIALSDGRIADDGPVDRELIAGLLE